MRVLSLFSGIGGLDLAAEWAGMTTVAFCERDKYCQKVLAKHWPGVPIFDDVTTLKGDQVGTVDLITGGFPCQPFSVAGKKLGRDDDRYLWPEYLRLIQELRPSWVVGENVIGIVGLALDNVLADLESNGYTARTFDIPAGAVGAPHERRRIFIVAHSGCEGFQGLRRPAEIGESVRQKGFAWPEFVGGKTLGEIIASVISRVGDGLSNRAYRLRALGNAVVPQQAYPIFKAIAEVSR